MQAAVFNECGGPEKIHIADVPNPIPGEDEVLIQIKSSALNHFDLYVLGGPDDGSYTFPFWGGADIAGVVVEASARNKTIKVGDRVLVNPDLYCGTCEHCLAGEESMCVEFGIIGDTIPGGFAEYIAVKADDVFTIPDDFSFEEAAAVPLVFQTAWRAITTRAQIKPGEDVLIMGASGGVSTAAIQIAKLKGARVFAVTSTPEKVKQVQELGADFVLNRSEGDYWAELADLTNKRGVDVIVESVGAATWGNYFNHLVNGGRLVTYGNTSRGTAETELSPIYWNQRQIIGTTMSNRKEFAEVMQLIFERKLHPVIDKVFPLEQASAAYERIDKGEQFGKIILKIDD